MWSEETERRPDTSWSMAAERKKWSGATRLGKINCQLVTTKDAVVRLATYISRNISPCTCPQRPCNTAHPPTCPARENGNKAVLLYLSVSQADAMVSSASSLYLGPGRTAIKSRRRQIQTAAPSPAATNQLLTLLHPCPPSTSSLWAQEGAQTRPIFLRELVTSQPPMCTQLTQQCSGI